MDCPPRRRENARAVRDMIRGLMESVFPQIGPKIRPFVGLRSTGTQGSAKLPRIGGTLRNRSGNEAESQRERRSLRLRRWRWRAQAARAAGWRRHHRASADLRFGESRGPNAARGAGSGAASLTGPRGPIRLVHVVSAPRLSLARTLERTRRGINPATSVPACRSARCPRPGRSRITARLGPPSAGHRAARPVRARRSPVRRSGARAGCRGRPGRC